MCAVVSGQDSLVIPGLNANDVQGTFTVCLSLLFLARETEKLKHYFHSLLIFFFVYYRCNLRWCTFFYSLLLSIASTTTSPWGTKTRHRVCMSRRIHDVMQSLLHLQTWCVQLGNCDARTAHTPVLLSEAHSELIAALEHISVVTCTGVLDVDSG